MESVTFPDEAFATGRAHPNWRRAWTYHFDPIWHLVRRDLCLRYTGSVLGVLWSVLLPLTQLLVLVFLFQKVVLLGIDAYPAFASAASLPANKQKRT